MKSLCTALATVTMAACLTATAQAAEINLTSGFITYEDGDVARVYVFNGNDPASGPCEVQVSVYDEGLNLLVSQIVSANPNRANYLSRVLPSLASGVGTFRVDVDYVKSGVCSQKTLYPYVEIHHAEDGATSGIARHEDPSHSPNYPARNRYEVGFRKSKTVT